MSSNNYVVSGKMSEEDKQELLSNTAEESRIKNEKLEASGKELVKELANSKNQIRGISQLMGNRLLIENIPHEEEITKGGILIAITVTRPKKGKIFKIGLTVQDDIKKLGGKPLKTGDEILYEPQDYPGITIDNKTYDTILIDSLIAVL